MSAGPSTCCSQRPTRCPGTRVEVASTGGQLTNIAAQIHSDVTWLKSLCTAQFWDSGAGQAFQVQVDGAAAKLARQRGSGITRRALCRSGR